MTTSASGRIVRIANAGLRMMSLVAKLGLTLYMGRYLSLADLGVYGLVSGAVVILMDGLGIRFDYIVTRELVGADNTTALIKMRDQAIFYGFNYLVLAALMIALTLLDVTGVSSKIMLAIFVLAVLESSANMTYLNIISMGRPLVANILFFIRSGFWVLPVVGLGLLVPAFRSSYVIFTFWASGMAVSLAATLWVWRSLPWGESLHVPINWHWVKTGVLSCIFIWLGSIGNTCGFYVSRFVVAHSLGLDQAGVATFYSSFVSAMGALIQSGVLAFAYPHLIKLHQKHDEAGFRHEVRSLLMQVSISAGIIATGMGICVPLLGRFFHRPLLVEEAPTLWLMLVGVWIIVNATTLYYVLFARRQDRAVWLGDLLYLIPTFGCNMVLVPLVGFQGIGYSAIISSLWLFLWRGWHVRYGYKRERKPAVPIETQFPEDSPSEGL